MNLYALQRENNDTWNQRALREISGTGGIDIDEAPPVQVAKVQRGKQRGAQGWAGGRKKQPKVKQARQAADEDKEESAESSGDESRDTGMRSEAPATRGRTRGQQAVLNVLTTENAPVVQTVPAAQPAQMAENEVPPEKTPNMSAATMVCKGASANEAAKENGVEGTPKWAVEAKATLENGSDEWGSGWAKLVGL
jgi:hypothetical protein